ncbi:MAG: methyltransferase, TIGR04325 family [Deltaproteobacteria bacterium]|nr:methyltransferase, TIGR04325 family [Deltaproteobacteria bacterium]
MTAWEAKAGVKELIRLLLPPLFVNLARTLRGRVSFFGAVADYEHVPDGWDYQRSNPWVRGWDEASVAELQARKWARFKELVEGPGPLGFSHEGDLSANADAAQHNTIMIFAYSIALASRDTDTLSMLDWGGGLGHYYLLARSLLPGVEIQYHCKDLPTLVAQGARTLPDQKFYSDESCLDRTYDFVLASGSLHYAEDWQSLLARLARATRRFLLINRLVVCRHAASYVFVQRPYSFGYNTEYVGWCLNRQAFLEEARRNGLELVREFILTDTPYIFRAPEQSRTQGFLFRARGA